MQPTQFQDNWINQRSYQELQELKYSWEFWGRPEQQFPLGNWFVWLILAGRGFGKTRTLTETCLRWYREGHERINLASRTSGDIRKTMLFGPSGIITKAPPKERPRYVTSLKELHWPCGRVSLCFSADEPEQGRGPGSDKLLVDELGAWPDDELWNNLQMGLREGKNPQCVVATTGRRKKFLRLLAKDPETLITRGSTWDNAHNLGKRYLRHMMRKFEGTTQGKEELYGDILDDYGGAFWTEEMIDACRVASHPRLTRIVMGVDPAVTSGLKSDRVGIIIGGIGIDDEVYILADLSLRGSPGQWVEAILTGYKKFKCSLIRAETNRGGELIQYCLQLAAEKGEELPEVDTFNSQNSKASRIEPCATAASKGLIHHVGHFPELEEEQTTWDPSECRWSPNALDAYSFVVEELLPNMEPEIEGFQVDAKTGLYLPTNRIHQIGFTPPPPSKPKPAPAPAKPGALPAPEPDEDDEDEGPNPYARGGRLWH